MFKQFEFHGQDCGSYLFANVPSHNFEMNVSVTGADSSRPGAEAGL